MRRHVGRGQNMAQFNRFRMETQYFFQLKHETKRKSVRCITAIHFDAEGRRITVEEFAGGLRHGSRLLRLFFAAFESQCA